jgi:hypothetical protein
MQLFTTRKILASTFAVSFILGVSFASAQEPTTLQAAMQAMAGSLKTLNLNILKPDESASNLALLQKLKEGTQISATQIPPRADKLVGQATWSLRNKN